MARTRTFKWDPAQHLKTDADVAAYLEAALEEGDPALVALVLGDIARAKGMSEIARSAGLGRESLYKALSADGNPEFSTVLKVVKALGLRFQVGQIPANAAPSAQEPAAKDFYTRGSGQRARGSPKDVKSARERTAAPWKGSHLARARRLGLVGCIEGPPDLARNYEKYLRRALRAKIRAR